MEYIIKSNLSICVFVCGVMDTCGWNFLWQVLWEVAAEVEGVVHGQ